MRYLLCVGIIKKGKFKINEEVKGSIWKTKRCQKELI